PFKRSARARCPSGTFAFACECKPGLSVIWMRSEPLFEFFNGSLGTVGSGKYLCLNQHRVPFLRSATHRLGRELEGLIVTALAFKNLCNSDVAPGIARLKRDISSK